ncbi:sugar ABC transporter ATP-binding protein [Lysobacter caseinilyticus]|uniref:Sugar ABC transporter ATP-binding protein n=1 Tax=Noviluteimonas caseinilytica TaxID=2675101 RepID=A0ABM7Q9I6_9GAMM|nr:sn-glycerol-3-phosphate ABC transporter ATP-binding protein UgpC [Lysobacter caseinilyticus]BCT94031.1 sugar ABC transporter ATP-binding protein [Lysobacter caseinilyticus]
MAQVSLEQVRKVYPAAKGTQPHVAVAGATFDVADGELLVLVGPSGCGKSTLLRMIAGLESITSGTLRIGDRVVNDVAPKDRDIAMVFQNYALYPHMDVAGNLGFGLKLRGASKDEIARRVGEAAKTLELDALLARKPGALSGGQRQRVALGRALVRDPQVFLLDEPLSNLDAKLRTGMRVEIARLHRQLGATMVYVTHDQVEAMTLGQRIVVLKDGHVQQIDTPMALYERPANLFVATFLGSPAMNVLRGRVVRADGLSLDMGEGVRVPLGEGAVPEAWIDRDIAIGVRPEHLVPAPAGGVSPVVEMVEALGNETLVNLRLGAQALVARVAPHAAPSVGSAMPLALAAGQWHAFDAGSGGAVAGLGGFAAIGASPPLPSPRGGEGNS